jgi:hypothetical protein
MRSDVYAKLTGQSGYRSMGGRSNHDAIRAWLNTDNGQGSDCDVTVRAEVVGERNLNGKPRKTCHNCGHKFADKYPQRGERCPQCNTARQGQDTRKSVFSIELPDSKFDGDACQVNIVGNNDGLRQLAEVGAFLCGVKGALDLANGNTQQGKQALAFSKDTLRELSERDRNVPANVRLPGGVSLDYALACVEFCKRLMEDSEENQEGQK